jgi:hypothetical protein
MAMNFMAAASIPIMAKNVRVRDDPRQDHGIFSSELARKPVPPDRGGLHDGRPLA